MFKKLTLISTTILISLLAMSCATPKQKEVYLQLYSLRSDIHEDFDATLDAVAEMGYTGVETANYHDGKFYGLSPEDFRNEIESRNMTVLSSHLNRSLGDLTQINWDEIWAWWDQAIDAHKRAGMKYLVVPAMPKFDLLSDLQIYCDYYNQIGEKCNEAGMKFGYHNHAFEFEKIEDEIMYDYMLKNTDPDKVHFQMDVYWVVRGGKTPVDYFNAYPGRFETLHIKDSKELGQSGMVGFDAIFNNMDLAGTRYIIVEVEDYNYTPIESVKKSLEYLQAHPQL